MSGRNEGEDRVAKEEVWLDLDICPGSPIEFLDTPLSDGNYLPSVLSVLHFCLCSSGARFSKLLKKFLGKS